MTGVALYWAEGSKSKPYRRHDRVVVINSDVGVIKVLLAWLQLLGVDDDLIGYRLSIHETADVAAAEDWWATELKRSITFARPSIKKAKPRTKRLNTGADYHGCLVLDVKRSAALYQRVEGAWRGIVAGSGL